MGCSLDLLRLAHDKIKSGKLPCISHPKTWGGFGRGSVCSLCGNTISNQQPEIEVQVESPTGLTGALFKFHVSCHFAWLEACDEAPRVQTG